MRFCAECLMPGTGSLSIAELRTAYRDWCWRRGLRPLSRRAFRHDFERVARRNGLAYSGHGYVGVCIDEGAAGQELARLRAAETALAGVENIGAAMA